MLDESPRKPKFLYKFRSLAQSDYDMENLVSIVGKNELKLSAPASFNDPFDCRAPYDEAGMSDKEHILGRMEAMKRIVPGMSEMDRLADAIRWFSDPVEGPHSPEFIRNASLRWQEVALNKVGVLCLTPFPKSELMWAHYANNHRGVCIQFDGRHRYFEPARPVHYTSQRPALSLGPSDVDTKLRAALYTKSDKWAYEGEWRQVAYRDQMAKHGHKVPGWLPYPMEALTGLILGAMISAEDRKQVLELVRETGRPIRVYQMRMAERSYRLHADLIRP